jgi:hypothetical protein
VADRKIKVIPGVTQRLGKVLTSEQAAALGSVIDITETHRGQLTQKLFKEYDELLKKDLGRGILSKTPSFKDWAVKKYGQAVYQQVVGTSSEFSQVKEFLMPAREEYRGRLLKKLVEDANKGSKIVKWQDILSKVSEGSRYDKSYAAQKYYPLLHREADKVRMAFDKIVEADEIIEWPKKGSKYHTNPLTAMIAERTGVLNRQYIDGVLAKGVTAKGQDLSKIGVYKPKHIYPKELLNIAGRSGAIELSKPFSEILEEAEYRKGGGVTWSKKSIRPDTANTINDFALRHWDHHKKHKTLNSQIEFFYKKNPQKPIEWNKIKPNKNGTKSLKGSEVFFKYKNPRTGKWDPRKWDTGLLNKEGRQSKLFEEVYAAKNEYNKLLSKRVPDPKTGKIITFEELMKKTYKKGYGFSDIVNVYAVEHEKLVADKPFNALRVTSKRLNDQLNYISRFAKQKNFKKILMGSLDLTQIDDPLKAGQELAERVLVEGYKVPVNPGTGKPMTSAAELAQTVLKKDLNKLSRPMVNKLVNLFSKSTNRKIVEPILEAAALDSNNICEIVFGRTGVRFSKANGGTGCAAEMEDALNQKPVQTLKKIEQMPSKPGMVNAIQNTAKKVLNILPKLGTPGKIAAGAVAGAAAIGALTYNKELGEFVNPLNDDKASQATVTEWIKDNPVKTVAGTSIGFSTQEIPGAYKKARELGRGRVRSSLGITGALKPVLTTFGTPAMTALFEAPFAAKRLEEGETMTEVLTDPLGPALGLSLMETLSQKAGVVRDAPKRTMLEGAKNYFNLSNVGTARPGVTSKILRMGMSPRMIAGASRFLGLPGLALSLGLTGYGAYKNYQNEEGMLYNLFNKDE